MSTKADVDRLVTGITKNLIDQGKLIEAGFALFRANLIAKDASDLQVSEMRLAFFAGAQHLFGSIMTALDPGPDDAPTDADLRRMDIIHAELEAFANELRLRIRTKGSA